MRPIIEEMPTTAPPPVSSIVGTAARVRAWAVATFHENSRMSRLGRRVEERAGHRAADVVDDDVDAAELLRGDVGQAGHRVEVAEVGRHHDRLAAERLDLLGDRVELLLRARRQHDVGAGLGERERRRGADAAARAGHDGHLVVEAEPVLDHPAKLLTGTRCDSLMTCVTSQGNPRLMANLDP